MKEHNRIIGLINLTLEAMSEAFHGLKKVDNMKFDTVVVHNSTPTVWQMRLREKNGFSPDSWRKNEIPGFPGGTGTLQLYMHLSSRSTTLSFNNATV